MDTRLRADYILAHRGDGHALLRDGEVIVRDDRIHYVVDQTIELGTSLLMPGFIDRDALADIHHAIFDSCWGTEHSAGLSYRSGSTWSSTTAAAWCSGPRANADWPTRSAPSCTPAMRARPGCRWWPVGSSSATAPFRGWTSRRSGHGPGDLGPVAGGLLRS